MIEFMTDREIYDRVISMLVPSAQRILWLATSDLKDLHVHKGRKMIPFLEVIANRIENGVSVRLIHAKEPGPAFRADFDRYPVLIEGLERLLCPRVHFKSVIIDGEVAYTGSANLTGAGMGAKSVRKRNFENGFVTDEPDLVKKIMEQFDRVWMGQYCDFCGRASYCADRKDMI